MQSCESKRSARERVCVAGWGLMAAALLSACGGGGGGGGSGPSGPDLSSRNYLPAAVGDRWIYSDSTANDPVRVKVVGTTTVGGQSGVVLRSTAGSEVVLVEDASGVRQIPGPGAEALMAAVGPVQLMRYPLQVGDSFTNLDKSIGSAIDFDGDGFGDITSVRGNVQVLGLSALATAVGTLADCLHLRSTYVYTIQLSSVARTVTMTETADDWLAPGIGVVQSQLALAAGGATSTATLAITAYGVGSLRSEYVAPTASEAFLAGGAALGPSTTVDVAFDEDMDPDSLAAALTVTDAQGHPVAGSVATTARLLRFTPAPGWTTGDFTARLAAATDVVGNPAPAAAWNFSIDATAPSVVGTQPLQGAVDVPLASAIELSFSEPVLGSTVNDRTINVLYDGAFITVVGYQVDGNKVTLTPASNLARGKVYTIYVGGVTDAAGNPAVATSLSFTTDPGRFGAPTRLPGPVPDMRIGSNASAIGDVNGDGLPDLVSDSLQFVDSMGRWESKLAIYLQHSGALPALPEFVPLQPYAQAIGIVIADIDQDGRNDVVVGEGELGVEIFRQGTDGRLLPGQLLATGITARLRVADMNADGRPDIVSYGDNMISVWQNLPGGWSRSDAVTVTSYPVTYDLAVGDINGDGRPDVVFVGHTMPDFAAAGVIRQGTDGRLGAPEWLHYGINESAFYCFVGDVDNDGRVDLGLSFSSGIAIARQQADGSLAPLAPIDSPLFPGTPRLADINGDSWLDLLSVDGLGAMAVRLGQAGGSWAETASYPGTFLGTPPSSSALAAGDLNSDGRTDVVASGHLFTQRPVPLMSQSVGPVRPARASRSPALWLRSVLEAQAPRR